MNQRSVTGPNSQPTVPVPLRCSMNSATRMATAIGTTRCATPGLATSRPDTAESTEIAGVIMPSPKNSEAPKIPRVTRSVACTSLLRRTNDASAMMPPSPRLWARMMKPAYLVETTIASDQKISETIP